MLIPHHRLAFCFEKAKEVTDSYKLWMERGGEHTLKSVSKLIDAIKPTLTGDLEILELNELYSVSEARAFFLVDREGSYKIIHMQGQNICWNRLVICKELFHVLLDSEESRNIGIADHIAEFMSSFPDRENVPSIAVISEWQAEFAAMEFLFPYKDRLVILSMTDYVSSDVASRYRIPKVMVERYLSEEYINNIRPFFSA